MKEMTIREALTEYMKKNGYDGLYNDEPCCCYIEYVCNCACDMEKILDCCKLGVRSEYGRVTHKDIVSEK